VRPFRLGTALAFWVAGCGAPGKSYPEALQSEHPAERVPAIKQAAEMQDRSAVPRLVDCLEDEDEAVRFYAILALERLTGTRQAYDYHASRELRERAVQRWRRYLAGRDTRGGVVDEGSNGMADGGPDP